MQTTSSQISVFFALANNIQAEFAVFESIADLRN
jgi:hypothetical protein